MSEAKEYELYSREPKIPLNKTAGRFYFEKFNNNFMQNPSLYKKLFGYEKLSEESKREIFKEFVCIINLETNGYCNRTCSYCPLSLFDRKSKTPKNFSETISIDNILFSKIIDELKEIDYQSTICLNLYNEPLSDIYLFERIREIKQKLPSVFLRFNSNGDFLDKDLLYKLSKSGLDSINITLHTLKNEIYDDEKSHTKILNFYKKIGLQAPEMKISKNQNITSSLQIENLLLLVNTSNWSVFGNDRGGGMSELSIKGREDPCVKIFREVSIDYKGNVFFCCNIFPDDPKNKSLGNLNDKTLFDIFASKKFSNLREHLFDFSPKKSPCSTCNEQSFSNKETHTADKILKEIRNIK